MSSVKETLAQYAIRPRKKLGQSFLQDMNMMRRIVALAELSPEETVVEIGAGLGFMTEELSRQAGRVIALEIDPRLLEILRERFSENPSVDVVAGDVLDYDFSADSPVGNKIKVVGNVPYHISTPILFHLLDSRKAISTMVLMFQKELADRIMAIPGSKDYGIPSVITARCGTVSHALTVPPACFYPAPSIFSAVLRIAMRSTPLTDHNYKYYCRVVRMAFAQRRKTLWNNLRSSGMAVGCLQEVFALSGIDSVRRAETLSCEEFTGLTKACMTVGLNEKWLDKGTRI
jgi:16S rRNA (adenine1518-N6/adenine1519-N6)-dimethyltransferase